MFRTISRIASNNVYVLVGVLLGMYLSSLVSDTLGPFCAQNDPLVNLAKNLAVNNYQTAPKVNFDKKTSPSLKKTKLIRPRYYSTELGIREKLFVGVFTSEDRVNTLATHLNKTIGHLVDKVKYFITAQYKLKDKFNLTGIVGFTDTRSRYRPFQILKYIGDNFAQDFDYYFLCNDYTFINAHKLNDVVKKISVSMDVYLGNKVVDASYCDLDSGIILSNSVLKSVREHLDWCVINAVADDPSENIGRCIHHSIGLTCQDSVEGQHLKSFKLKHFELNKHLVELTKKDDFNDAVTVHPILQSDNFYILNTYFLKRRLVKIKEKIDVLSADLTEIWPPGQRPGARPATRFDLPHQFYFNMTHIFLPDDFVNVRRHSLADLQDIENVIEEVKLHFDQKTANSTKYQFRRLINGYRTFDLSRGMDYTLDLGYRDSNTGKEVIKRFEVCKPLGKVEFIPMPYVTENSRVTILLPVQEDEISTALEFLQGYTHTIMDRKEKTFLMLILLYQYNSNNKGSEDVFGEIKNFALKTSDRYRTDDVKMAWVSVRLPERGSKITMQQYKSLNFAVVDLALKKIGLESLLLILDPFADVTGDFLNRVRMNTVPNFQIFSPIPFRQYNPQITQQSQFEVNKNSGHFDREEYKYISFYGKDYVNARKKYQNKMPLIRVDNDIGNVLGEDYNDVGNIFEMFVKCCDEIHSMRATEMNLKVKYHEEFDTGRCNLFLGNQAQLGRLLLTKKEFINVLT